jgi:hypothetical protein
MRAVRAENYHFAVIARAVTRRCWRSLLAVLLVGMPLAGCIEKQPVVAQKVELPPREPEPSPPAIAPVPVSGEAQKPVARARRERPEKKIAMFDPLTLVGMTPPDIGRILGRPAGTREEALSIEWIYETRTCSLVIFFYPDIATGALRALKYNVHDSKENAGDGRNCVQKVLLARQ